MIEHSHRDQLNEMFDDINSRIAAVREEYSHELTETNKPKKVYKRDINVLRQDKLSIQQDALVAENRVREIEWAVGVDDISELMI